MPSELDDFDEFPADAVWLQQEDETDQAYAAFCYYRDMGPRRSLRQAARDYYRLQDLPDRTGEDGGKVRQIEKWSALHAWGERASAYARHQDLLNRIDAAEKLKEMNRRHAAIAGVAMAKAAERLNEVQARDLTMRDATILLDMGSKLERLARGAATEIVGGDDAHDSADTKLRPVLSDPNLALAARELAVAIETKRAELEDLES